MSSRTVGVVGLGNVGGGLATRVARSGVPVVCYDVRAEACESMAALGAAIASSAVDVARQAQVVITSLPHPDVSREVYLSEDGLLAGAGADSVLIEASTVPPAVTRQIADVARQHGVSFFEAAVLGGVRAAASGQITLAVGGARDDVEAVRDILQILAKRILVTGGIGTAMTAKIVNNAVSHANMAVLCESIAIGVKLGLDAGVLREILSSGTGDSYQVRERFGRRILIGDYSGGASIDIIAKDSEFVLDLASELEIELPVMVAAHGEFKEAQRAGLGNADYAALIQPWERKLGIDVRASVSQP